MTQVRAHIKTRSTSTVSVEGVSKWFGNVVAVNDVSFEIRSGVTGLLGPNGAGKTTLLRMMCGLSSVSEGKVRVLGVDPRDDESIYSRIGIMSEHESAYEFMTGSRYVEFSAALKGVEDPIRSAVSAIETVNLEDDAERKISTYSRGMKQRIRLAAALVSDPDLLIFDEPMNGADPHQRIQFQDTVHRLASEGKTIVISSHILEEVESVAENVLLVVSGKLAAQGDFRAIRAALDDRPYHVRIQSSDSRLLASLLARMPAIDSVQFTPEGDFIALTSKIGQLQIKLPYIASKHNITLMRMEPLDDSLESVFSYLAE